MVKASSHPIPHKFECIESLSFTLGIFCLTGQVINHLEHFDNPPEYELIQRNWDISIMGVVMRVEFMSMQRRDFAFEKHGLKIG